MIKKDVLLFEDYIHSYPYDWRTKGPIIIRASKQWFLDTNKIKDRAIVSKIIATTITLRILNCRNYWKMLK